MKAEVSRRSWLKAAGVLVASAAFMPVSAVFASKKPQNFRAQGLKLWQEFNHFPAETAVLKAKLNANENPFGPSEMVQQAIQKSIKLGNRYAFGELGVLRELLAQKEGVKPEQILIGAGSTEMLEKIAVTLFKEEGEVISASPAYMSLIGTSIAVGAEWKPVKLQDNFSHDLDAMQAAINSATKLVYICNPNNPTGSITDPVKLRSFCDTVSEKVPVFVDEAYLDYLPADQQISMVDAVRKGKKVIVARTFSKINGMAGLRVGYIVAHVDLIAAVKADFFAEISLNPLSVQAAIAALADEPFRELTRKEASEAREFTYGVLKSLNITWVPSHTSFVIFPLESDGKKFMEAMTGLGVGIRIFNFWDKEWCRVSMGTKEEMNLFASSLRRVLA